jgi:hypothetical protein
MTEETYLRSVDILLDAYNNETLLHGNCYACAIGNLLHTNVWKHDFMTIGKNRQMSYRKYGINVSYGASGEVHITEYYLDDLYKEHGFTREEVMKIEYAFESSLHLSIKGYGHYFWPGHRKEGQFIGLTAVLKVMAELVDTEVDSLKHQERLEKIASEKFGVLINTI